VPGVPVIAPGAPPPVQLPVRAAMVSAIPGVVAAGATWAEVWKTGGNNADGALSAPDGGLLLAQEDNNAIVKLDVSDRALVFMSNTGGAGSLSMDRQGRLMAVQRMLDPRAASSPSAPGTAAIAVLSPERRVVANKFVNGTTLPGRPNDLAADSQGGAYFTQGSCVYQASATGTIAAVADNMRTNGIVLSPDDKTLYVTNGPTVTAFDVQASGALMNRRDFGRLEAGGNGDGLAVDAAGRLYVTSAPGVQVFSAAGMYLGLIPTPRPVISLAFAGPDKNLLYVVGAGATGPNGQPVVEGPQQTGRTVYKLAMLAAGYKARAK
jgi:gluconolactonase